MSNNNRNDNSKPNYIYPQPYIDPMVYLNPYYSNATGYQYNSQGYVEYPNNTGYIDYSQFNDNPANTYPDQNYINNNTYDSGGEYTNIPAEDINIPSVICKKCKSNIFEVGYIVCENKIFKFSPDNSGNPYSYRRVHFASTV